MPRVKAITSALCFLCKKINFFNSSYTKIPPNKAGNIQRNLIRIEATEPPADQVRMKVSIKPRSAAHPVGWMRVYFKCY